MVTMKTNGDLDKQFNARIGNLGLHIAACLVERQGPPALLVGRLA